MRASPGIEVMAIELDPAQAGRARAHPAGRAGVVEADAARLPFAAGHLGAVVELNALHHIPDVRGRSVVIGRAGRPA